MRYINSYFVNKIICALIFVLDAKFFFVDCFLTLLSITQLIKIWTMVLIQIQKLIIILAAILTALLQLF